MGPTSRHIPVVVQVSAAASLHCKQRRPVEFSTKDVLAFHRHEHVEIQLELKNELAFRLAIEGVGELVPIDNGKPFSLNSQISPGSHSIRISGRALAKQWDEGRPSDYAFGGSADHESSGTFRGKAIDYWVDQLRQGKIHEIKEAGFESIEVWEAAARDPQAVTWVKHVFTFRDVPWQWRVYVAMLEAADPSFRETALHKLDKMDPESLQMATIPLLKRTRSWLSSDDRQVQRLVRPALELVSSQDPLPKGFAEFVIEAWHANDDPQKRRLLGSALESLAAQDALPEDFTELVIEAWPTVQSDHVFAPLLFSLLSGQGERGITALIDLSVQNKYARSDFVNKFRDVMKHADSQALQSLLKEIQSADPDRQVVASQLLGKAAVREIADSERELIEQTYEVLMCQGRYRLVATAARLFAVLGEAALPQIRKATESNDYDATMTACSVLGFMNPLPKAASPLLLKFLDDRNVVVRKRTISVISGVLCDDPVIVAALIDSLDDPKTQKKVIEALGSLGPAAEQAIASLGPFLENEDPSIKLSAARSIWSISNDAPVVLPAARSMVRDEQDAMLLRGAAGLLGNLAMEARPAVDDLKRLLQHDDQNVRAAASRAIEKVEAEYFVHRRSRVGEGSRTTVYSYSLVESKDRIVATVKRRTRWDRAHWSLVIFDESFKALDAWTGDAEPHASGGSSRNPGKEVAEQVRQRGKFVAFILSNGDDSPPTPKTMAQCVSAIPGFGDNTTEIQQLEPGQTKSLGPWHFTRIGR